jgi:hypothetical protein
VGECGEDIDNVGSPSTGGPVAGSSGILRSGVGERPLSLKLFSRGINWEVEW